MKELTLDEKIEAIEFMKESLNIRHSLNYSYALCNYFGDYIQVFMHIDDFEFNINPQPVFPEFFNPINQKLQTRNSDFAWEKDDFQSRLDFLENLEKELISKQTKS